MCVLEGKVGKKLLKIFENWLVENWSEWFKIENKIGRHGLKLSEMLVILGARSDFPG